MTKDEIAAFIAEIQKKNAWGKNEVIDLFQKWTIDVLLKNQQEEK